MTISKKVSGPSEFFLGQLLPLLFKNTTTTGLIGKLPATASNELKQGALRIIAWEMASHQMLKEALDILSNHDIPVILLKGAAFARNLYPSDSPRIGVDADLFIGQKNYKNACDLLKSHMISAETIAKKSMSYSSNFESAFYSRSNGSSYIELHQQLKNPYIFNIRERDLWADCNQHPFYSSNKVLVLSPEHTLLHLAIHAFRDLNFCSHNLLDAHEVYCQWQPNLEVLLNTAKKWRCKHILFMLLSNCKILMNTPVPDDLLENLKPGNFTDNMNKCIIQSNLLLSNTHNKPGYRLIQLASQIFFPDNKLRGILFQLHYVKTQLHSAVHKLRYRNS